MDTCSRPKKSRMFKFKDTTWPLEWGKQAGVYMLMKEVSKTSPGRSEVEGYGECINSVLIPILV